MMNGNNGDDKYNNCNSIGEMSLYSLLHRGAGHGESSSRSLPISLAQQRRNRVVDVQDLLEQALEMSSDIPSDDSSNAVAPPRSRSNHQGRSGNSADDDDNGHTRAKQ
jgi:hypothetical protein